MGTEKQSEEMVDYLLQQFEGDTGEDLGLQYFWPLLP